MGYQFLCVVFGAVPVPSYSVKYKISRNVGTSSLIRWFMGNSFNYVTFLSVFFAVTLLAFHVFRFRFCVLPRLTSGNYSWFVRCCCAFCVSFSMINHEAFVVIAFKVHVVPPQVTGGLMTGLLSVLCMVTSWIASTALGLGDNVTLKRETFSRVLSGYLIVTVFSSDLVFFTK